MPCARDDFARGEVQGRCRVANSTDAVHKGGKSQYKWSGIAALGTELFAAPYQAPVLLVVETLAGMALRRYIANEVYAKEGKWSVEGKWSGISALGNKLFAPPSHAPVLLVFDTLAGLVLRGSNRFVVPGLHSNDNATGHGLFENNTAWGLSMQNHALVSDTAGVSWRISEPVAKLPGCAAHAP